jgi:hypothetical protein
MTTRVLAPANSPSTTAAFPDGNPSGYTAAAGMPADMWDADAVTAVKAGWSLVGGIGPTSGRAAWLQGPAATAWLSGSMGPGFASPLFYYDTTLSKLVGYDGVSVWFDPATGSAV